MFPSQLFPPQLFPPQIFDRPAAAAGPAPTPAPTYAYGAFNCYVFNAYAFDGGGTFVAPSSGGGPPVGVPYTPYGAFNTFTFNAVAFDGNNTSTSPILPVTYNGIDILAAIESWWGAVGNQQVPTADGRLWHLSAPENTFLPYATFFLVSEVPETWTTSYAWKRGAVQINLHAATSQLARVAGKNLRAALKGAPLAIDGSAVMHVLPSGTTIVIGEGLAPRGKDCWIAAETFDIPWTE